jgi:type II secretory pathway pseudopilin PulG
MPRKRGFSSLEWGLVAIIISGLALLWSELAREARDQARSDACRTNLKQLAATMHLYAADYDGFLPKTAANLDGLYPFVVNEQLLHCPSAQPGAKPGGDYYFALGLATDWDPRTLLVWDDEAGRHWGQTWLAAHLDGSLSGHAASSYHALTAGLPQGKPVHWGTGVSAPGGR